MIANLAITITREGVNALSNEVKSAMEFLNNDCPYDGKPFWGCPHCHYRSPPEPGVGGVASYGECRIWNMQRDKKIYG
jgi:hypothetical protein